MGQDVERSFAQRGFRCESVERGRGARPPAPLVRRRRRHARRADRQRVRRRRPDPDAGRVPDRVEQDPRRRLRGGGLEPHRGSPTSRRGVRAELGGGLEDDWVRLREIWGERFGERLAAIGERRLSLRVRMLGGTHIGYARLTRRWWPPVSAELAARGADRAPVLLRQLQLARLVNIVTGIAREREPELVAVRRAAGRGRHPARGADRASARAAARAPGRTSCTSSRACTSAARSRGGAPSAAPRGAGRGRHSPATAGPRCGVPAQVIPLDRLDPARSTHVSAPSTPAPLAASGAVIVNIDYPLGLAAYNILREVAVDRRRCAVSTSSARPRR